MQSTSKNKESSCLRANVSAMTAILCMHVYRSNYLIDVCQSSRKQKEKLTQFWPKLVTHTLHLSRPGSLARVAAGEGVRPARLRSIPGIGPSASSEIFLSVHSPLDASKRCLSRVKL